MEFKPLIDYSTPIKRKPNDFDAHKAAKALFGLVVMFFGFLVLLVVAGNAGYFN